MDKSSFHTSDIENVELMHECSPEHLRKRTVKLKYNKETGEEVKSCGVANNQGMNEMKIMIRFIFRSDLTRTKQRVSLPLSKIINTKVAFLIAKEQRV